MTNVFIQNFLNRALIFIIFSTLYLFSCKNSLCTCTYTCIIHIVSHLATVFLRWKHHFPYILAPHPFSPLHSFPPHIFLSYSPFPRHSSISHIPFFYILLIPCIYIISYRILILVKLLPNVFNNSLLFISIFKI